MYCVTIGTTAKFCVGPNGWFYLACGRCNKKTDCADQPFTCSCGYKNEKPVSKYKLEAEVYYQKEKSVFVFFDRECAQLIGMSADRLRKVTVEAGEIDHPKVYPKPLDDMLGCTLAYRIKVQPEFKNSAVSKISYEKDLIEFIKAHSAYDEGTSQPVQSGENVESQPTEELSIVNLHSQASEEICGVNLESQPVQQIFGVNLESQFETQALSASADHDPELVKFVTPAKRQPTDVQADENLSQDLASAQLSSTKLSKHIKTES